MNQGANIRSVGHNLFLDSLSLDITILNHIYTYTTNEIMKNEINE